MMRHAPRMLREEVYRACISIASTDNSEMIEESIASTEAENIDNSEMIEEILKLRREAANLIGYDNHAESSMAAMTATVKTADQLMKSLCSASWNFAMQDLEDLKVFSGSPDLNPWDILFWRERLRESKYGNFEDEMKNYFSLSNVRDGLFTLANRLFKNTIEAADGEAPVWSTDVKFYCIKDSSGSTIAYFYFYAYSSQGNKVGAKTQLVACRSCVVSQGSPRLPIACISCNQLPAVGGMTFDEVRSLFHEFGLALQLMLTKQDEGFVSGGRIIEKDAEKLPGYFMENWCYHRDTLMRIGKHYQTGESIPDTLYKKIIAARTFQAGSLCLNKLRLDMLDLYLNSEYVPGGSESIFDADRKIREITEVLTPLADEKLVCSFSHVYLSSSAAKSYSQTWAEVLASDAYAAFEEEAELMGIRFRDTFLAIGCGKPPLEVFCDFRRRGPSPEAWLKDRGFLKWNFLYGNLVPK